MGRQWFSFVSQEQLGDPYVEVVCTSLLWKVPIYVCSMLGSVSFVIPSAAFKAYSELLLVNLGLFMRYTDWSRTEQVSVLDAERNVS